MKTGREAVPRYTGQQAVSFLHKHGIAVDTDSKGYYQAMGLYYLYLADCMEQAEQVEDGVLFDESEVAILLTNMEEAKAAMEFYKKCLSINDMSFDVAETISLKGCRLENGKIIGDVRAAEQITRMWILNYFRGKGNAFMFEVGSYILFLLHQYFNYLW